MTGKIGAKIINMIEYFIVSLLAGLSTCLVVNLIYKFLLHWPFDSNVRGTISLMIGLIEFFQIGYKKSLVVKTICGVGAVLGVISGIGLTIGWNDLSLTFLLGLIGIIFSFILFGIFTCLKLLYRLLKKAVKKFWPKKAK
jgi:hypothetical protein